jgi:hypothetical protein
MAKYLVKELSFINNALVSAGETVDYDPPEGTTVSSNLELVTEDTDDKPKPRKPAKGGDPV